MNNARIDEKLLFAQNAITNSLNNQEIKSGLVEYRYDEVRLKLGKALYDKAYVLQAKQVKEYGDQYNATDSLNEGRALANKVYTKHLKLARIALEDNRGAGESLLLSGKRKESLSGWLKQARIFYTNALKSPEVMKETAEVGLTKEALTQGKIQVLEVESRLSDQLQEMGEAQNATEERDEAFEELQEWMSKFIKICRIAFEEKSQYLEMLGIVVPS